MELNSTYDEDILENKYFVSLQTTCPELYEAAASNRWMICVPRTVDAGSCVYNVVDFQNHILISIDEEGIVYKTASDKEVTIEGKSITTKAGFSDVRTVKILFEETFYNQNDESHRVLCIDNLFEGAIVEPAENSILSTTINTFDDCTELLWGHTGSNKTQKLLDKTIQTFNEACKTIEGRTLVNLVDMGNSLFTKSMQIVLKDPYQKLMSRQNQHYMVQAKVAVETYVLHHVYKRLFIKNLSVCVATKDATLNKRTRNLSELQLRDLDVRQDLRENLPKAKRELLNLNRYTTPLGKLNCIKRVVQALLQTPRKIKENFSPITTDDILPMLVFLVVKSEIANWFANLTYVSRFRFSKANNDDEYSFFAASLEASIEHINSGALSKLSQGGATFQMTPLAMGASKGGKLERQNSRPFNIEVLFQLVKDGDDGAVTALLNRNKDNQEDISAQLCHPLCSCDKCEKIHAKQNDTEASVTAFSRDDRGFTALHISAMYAQPIVTRTLIKVGGVVNAADYHGMTPLHIACHKGHQNVTLLLLHYKADLNSTDNDGNTPLHLSSANGHEECVKALLYFDKPLSPPDVNKGNDHGDTPLHLAAKWGYESIIKELLDHGASIEARNRKKQTPLHCAHNSRVSSLLVEAAELCSSQNSFVNVSVELPATSVTANVRIRPSVTIPKTKLRTASDIVSSPLPESVKKQAKQIVKLFKAITDGDIELVKFYLGWCDSSGEEEDERQDMSGRQLCHPLCQCDKCMPLQKMITLPGSIGVNTINREGLTPLYIACQVGQDKICETLLRHGAGINTKHASYYDYTPLHIACQCNKPKIVKILLNHDVKVNLKDSRGNTALHICCTNGAERCAMLLLEKGASLNQQNVKGNSPLHEASWWNFINMVELLLRHGAKKDIKNRQQLTPIQLAQGQDVTEILEEAANVSTNDVISSECVGKRQRGMAFSESQYTGLKKRFSMRHIFAAFEEDDLVKIQSLVESIQGFSQRSSLRHVETFDKSAPRLDKQLQHQLAIQHFDSKTLKPAQTHINQEPVIVVTNDNTNEETGAICPTQEKEKISEQSHQVCNDVKSGSSLCNVNTSPASEIEVLDEIDRGKAQLHVTGVSDQGHIEKELLQKSNIERDCLKSTENNSKCLVKRVLSIDKDFTEEENSNTESCDEIE